MHRRDRDPNRTPPPPPGQSRLVEEVADQFHALHIATQDNAAAAASAAMLAASPPGVGFPPQPLLQMATPSNGAVPPNGIAVSQNGIVPNVLSVTPNGIPMSQNGMPNGVTPYMFVPPGPWNPYGPYYVPMPPGYPATTTTYINGSCVLPNPCVFGVPPNAATAAAATSFPGYAMPPPFPHAAQAGPMNPPPIPPVALVPLNQVRPHHRGNHHRNGPRPPAQPREPGTKTALCRNMSERNHCTYGDSCYFAHSADELRAKPANTRYKTVLCTAFTEKGHCPYANKCHYIHPGEDHFEPEGPRNGAGPSRNPDEPGPSNFEPRSRTNGSAPRQNGVLASHDRPGCSGHDYKSGASSQEPKASGSSSSHDYRNGGQDSRPNGGHGHDSRSNGGPSHDSRPNGAPGSSGETRRRL